MDASTVQGLRELLDSYDSTIGCRWSPDTTMYAAANGHLDCLRYAHENGCPWHRETTATACCLESNMDASTVQGLRELLDSYGSTIEQYSSCPSCWLHNRGLSCNKNVKCVSKDTAVAATYGRIECLEYAYRHNLPWHHQTTAGAAANGNLDCLKYAYQNGCPWSPDTTMYAAGNGRLDCLRYAHENGCPWHRDTAATAAKHGQLSCLEYAHENGCPWDLETIAAAASEENYDCLLYACHNGCIEDARRRNKSGDIDEIRGARMRV